jgi:hypothetical protein
VTHPGADTGKLTPTLYRLAHPAGQPGSKVAQLPPASSTPDNTPGGLQRLPDGEVAVDIVLTDTSPATRARLAEAGATVIATSTEMGTVTATVAPDHLAAIEAVAQVTGVREDQAPETDDCTPLSQGDGVLKADQARANFGVNGTGQTVGILSDSFNRLTAQAPTRAAARCLGLQIRVASPLR